MRRRLLNLLTLLSLLLCVAVVVAAVRGYWTADVVVRRVMYRDQFGGMLSRRLDTVSLQRGGVVVASSTKLLPVPPEYDRREARWSYAHEPASPVPPQSWAFGGYARSVHTDPNPAHSGKSSRLFVPYWMLLAASAVLPAVRLYRYVRSHPTAGNCPRCGYDLCATPDRCPECGHTPAGSKA